MDGLRSSFVAGVRQFRFERYWQTQLMYKRQRHLPREKVALWSGIREDSLVVFQFLHSDDVFLALLGDDAGDAAVFGGSANVPVVLLMCGGVEIVDRFLVL